ncbi:MAG: glycogen/starch/alpha-glucan phosphorylase [Gammaproteobacteria bacterium]|nr:glycogen/starch/alpha-glucan phosphorylase [Gammaproteobacteria bacterium]
MYFVHDHARWLRPQFCRRLFFTRRVSDMAQDSELSKQELKQAFLSNLLYTQGKFPALATRTDYYLALAFAVRDQLLARWISTASAYTEQGSRTVCYLSAEFLLGPHLRNNLNNLGLEQTAQEAMADMGLDLEDLIACEAEPGLGNGGLGRLAACFIDSLATMEIPALGYGVRYEYGIFRQEIVDGWQVEKTDKWLHFGNPWEIARPEWMQTVRIGGHTEHYIGDDEKLRVRWVPRKVVNGVPYDTPILGYHTNNANTLRLWCAEAPESFDLATFNRGDYYGAVVQKINSENLTKVLYPNDETENGKELRLEQQYFFVSCSLQDMLRILKVQKIPLARFHEKFTIQLNDTHPAIAVAELMRLLLDECMVGWDEAWSITQKSLAYTNHTLLPEALERWPLALFQRVLPRHLEIIYEINARFLDEVRIRFVGDDARLSRMSIIDESGARYVRMANLASVGAHAINGVAALHSELLQQHVLRDFYELWPEKFSNKTNGVTPRRWIVQSNPGMTAAICDAIGDEWITNLPRIRALESFADDPVFRASWRGIKQANKATLARAIQQQTGIGVDPASMFDVQVKRIHEYKRQHLAALHAVALYLQMKAHPQREFAPRTLVFGGKAAPGYFMAKLIIKFITSVADVINRDPATSALLKMVFLPNFSVSNGQRVYPAADLSEQISTAGKEASGTGNMKFQMNGALTIGTMDGANIEIREEVGADNFFLFGLREDEVEAWRQRGYRPREIYNANPLLKEALDLVQSGFFSRGDSELFKPIVDNLLYDDPYFLLADFQSYADCQQHVADVWADQERWTRMSILNTARSGKFSSDRAIADYCRDTWRVEPVSVPLLLPDDVGCALLQ